MDLEHDGSEAGWEQQDQAEKERWVMTVDALDACRLGVASEAQIKFLARECGMPDWKPNAHARTASVG